MLSMSDSTSATVPTSRLRMPRSTFTMIGRAPR